MPKKRRKPKHAGRKKKPAQKPIQEDPGEEKLSREELRAKLRAKINEQKLSRTSRVIRDKEMDDVEERLNGAIISAREKMALKRKLKLLEKIEEKEMVDSMVVGDYADPG